MNSVSKYEAVGIFVSIAVMALALAFTRFDSSSVAYIFGGMNTARVVTSNAELESALQENISRDGSLNRLIIDDVRIGIGPEVKEGDTITVQYRGTLRDGTVFDDSSERKEPFTFTVGDGEVIEGWEKGVIGMQREGERILVIPSDMAYGNREIGPIPADSVLIFSLTLLEIQ